VALIVAELGMRSPVVCAALLHDTVEDTACTVADLHVEFGEEVAALVSGVQHSMAWLTDTMGGAGGGELARRRQLHEILVLKMADRLHNMRTLRFRSPSSQQLVSRETLAVHVPAARELGVGTLGRELEALASAFVFASEASARSRSFGERILTWAALLLPVSVRARWVEEWYGELSTLPTRRARLRFAADLVRGMPRLAATVRGPRRGPVGRSVLSALVSVVVGGGAVAATGFGALVAEAVAIAAVGALLVVMFVLVHPDESPARRLVELVKALRGTRDGG